MKAMNPDRPDNRYTTRQLIGLGISHKQIRECRNGTPITAEFGTVYYRSDATYVVLG